MLFSMLRRGERIFRDRFGIRVHCSLFLFSSRRRHTRSLCDWSSDVCSSDLYGYAIAEFADAIGEPFLPWQRWLAIHAMELTPDGFFRFRVIVVLVARQNGKSSVKRKIGRAHVWTPVTQ